MLGSFPACPPVAGPLERMVRWRDGTVQGHGLQIYLKTWVTLLSHFFSLEFTILIHDLHGLLIESSQPNRTII